ncbi:cytochrome c oxidase-assembly factorX23 [Populus alba x Populus x berolinensis]|nr:cytochrome c oxidase-assembly factorX23 [Populus alba x Populus x berolinensis]
MESKAAAATPPYPSSARFADSQCYPQYTASLKCRILYSGLEEFGSDKSKCQEHFDVYKECKKKEREARLERNKSRSFFS